MPEQVVTLVDPGPPPPPPKPTTSIQVGAVPTAPTEQPPPKPGSARERLFKELEKRGKPATGERVDEPPRPQPRTPPKAETPGEDEPEETPHETPKPAEVKPTQPAPSDPTKVKQSPWKIIDDYKSRLTKAETELVELRKGVVPKEQREKEVAEVEGIRKRNEELENEIRFVNYSKSKEYQENYETPYDQAWTRAMEELKELTIEDPDTGEQRVVQAKDLLQLVNMPLGKARETADQVFGAFADDVMTYRKEIRKLFEAKSKALDDARKVSIERDKANQEKIVNFQKTIKDAVDERWSKANEKIISHEKYGRYFHTVEGDENINQRLAKGYQMVDRALGENPHDPRLSAEQRSSIIDRHAALRHRAAAFGRVVYELSVANDRIAELEKKLNEYSASEPTTESGGAAPTGEGATSTPWGQLRAGLQKLAK